MTPNIDTLPAEIIEAIISRLDDGDVMKLSTICKALRARTAHRVFHTIRFSNDPRIGDAALAAGRLKVSAAVTLEEVAAAFETLKSSAGTAPAPPDLDAASNSDGEVTQPLANPAPDHELLAGQFETLSALEDELYDYAARAGFSIYRLRSSNKLKEFGYTRVDYSCAQSKIQSSMAKSRSTSTIKRDCSWQATAKALAGNGRRWTLEIRPGFEAHNHEVGVIKRRFTQEQKDYIATFGDRPAISNRELAEGLRERFPGIIFTRRQLMDQVDAQRRKIGAPAPETTITDYDTAMKNAVQRVYPLATPQICIFHVNKNVVLNIKRKWDKKAAEAVRREHVAAQLRASTQGTQGGDTDDHQPTQGTLGDPIRGDPAAEQPRGSQLREEGLDDEDMAVVRRLNRIAIDPHQPGATPADPAQVEHSMAGIYELWGHVLYAIDLDGFNTAWERLKAFFSEQTAIIEYLQQTYMVIAPEWATCYVNKRRNYGQRTTSPVESVNRYIKSYVVNGNSTVLQVVEQSIKMVDSMAEQIKDERNKQQTSIRREYLGKAWLGTAPYHIAIKALKMVEQQYRLMLPAVPTPAKPNPAPLPACTNKFTAQWGIPCSHRLLQKHQGGQLQLVKLDFDPF
ncbi:predicted protein [Chaetomium globosum CBS 148.51]|uniref:F-box domain-containing protein n=1 Tax=Chaetomium globosum (strain ATCC 6205 / CBS 148.51 / DSM 1962 / NBRC 6347 / NRRL 1970) TaxID=306901 RepID=Q2GMA2_CHAGB|nr:uncharacterized protein CHGG_10902 [Chaetomium globosum CBS 148.51]EAQ83084.1 predicted protein [Chaetomium globosum CBS 148.51]